MERAAGWVLGASVTIMALGLSIMAPALPLFGRTFGVGAAVLPFAFFAREHRSSASAVIPERPVVVGEPQGAPESADE